MYSSIVEALQNYSLDARAINTPRFKNPRASYVVEKQTFETVYDFLKHISDIIGDGRVHFYQVNGKTYEYIIEPRSAIIEKSAEPDNCIDFSRFLAR